MAEKPYIRSIKKADNDGFVIEVCEPQPRKSGKNGDEYVPPVEKTLTAKTPAEVATIVEKFLGGKSETEEALEADEEEFLEIPQKKLKGMMGGEY